MSRHPYLDAGGPIAFAHRGGAEEYPENTLRAFRHAVSLGYTHVETDVHATADGVAVAFHDDTLDRVTDGRGAVGELTWSQLRRGPGRRHRPDRAPRRNSSRNSPTPESTSIPRATPRSSP